MFHPLAVWAEGLGLWAKNFLPVVALSSISLLFARTIQMSGPLWVPEPVTPVNVLLSAFYVVEAVAAKLAYVFISLLIIHHLGGGEAGRAAFPAAFDGAKNKFFDYVKAILALFFFIFIAVILTSLLLSFGENFFRSPGGDRGVKLAALVGFSTVFVVALLAVAWYGFFFSLAPLVAAFEKKGPIASMVESRRRIRGSALRYLGVFLIFIAGYMGLGVLAYKALVHAGASRFVVNTVDAGMLIVFGPLCLILWYLSYEKLTEIKNQEPTTKS